MGIGRDLGLQLREWIDAGLDLAGSSALSNRLMDALGAEPTLRGPLRDLASQPLTLRALRLRGAEQQAALQSLEQLLAETYSPQVLAELLDLLACATGVGVSGAALSQPAAAAEGMGGGDRPGRSHPGEAAATDGAPAGGSASPPPARAGRHPLRRRQSLEAALRAIAPGLLCGATGALVLAWAAQELDRWTFARLGWSSGAALAAVLLLLQLLTLMPLLRPLRSLWLLDLPASGDPHRLWSWIAAPWLHRLSGEAILNALMLLILLGPTPLAPGRVVMRYVLTSLACLAGPLLVARRHGVNRHWGGASGAVAALIALAATLSLLQGHDHRFPLGDLAIPAWVLLLVNGGLQLSWQLPRQTPHDSSLPVHRLWSSTWWWGSLAGIGWALLTRAGELLGPLFRGVHG